MRQQHYRFAHQILVDAVLRNPDAWWAAVQAQGAAILQPPWAAAAQGLGPADLADGSSLAVEPMEGPGISAAVVTLPPPQAPAECYFIAVVRAPGAPPRYFVAERGTDADGGAPRAFWAEWRFGPGGGLMRIRGQDLPAISKEALLAAAAEECRAAPAPFRGPPPAAWGPLPAPPPKKKSKGWLIAGCGCLSLIGIVLAGGGFLLYQEEGRGLHVPDSEVASVPVTPGQPFTIQFTWDGTGYAFNNIWLVVDEGSKSGGDFKVKGTLRCSGGSSEKSFNTGLSSRNAHDVESKGADGFSAWIYLEDEYTRSSSRKIECSGTVEPVAGSWTKAHIAVTQRQRPGDFLAN